MREVGHKAVIQIVCIVSALKHIIAEFCLNNHSPDRFWDLDREHCTANVQTTARFGASNRFRDGRTDGWMDGWTDEHEFLDVPTQ